MSQTTCFGDATASCSTAPAGLLEFGNVSLVALRRLFGHDARDTAAFEHVIASFFGQAAVLLQRCLDRDIISRRRPRPRPTRATTLVIECASAFPPQFCYSTAVRSADDAALANKARIVLASGDAVVSNDSVPAALQEALAMVLEAKKQFASPHHRTAEDRVRLCRDLVRAAIDGGSKASSPSDAYKHWTEDGGTGADALAGVLFARPRSRGARNGRRPSGRPPRRRAVGRTSSPSDARLLARRIPASAASRTAACRRTSSRNRVPTRGHRAGARYVSGTVRRSRAAHP